MPLPGGAAGKTGLLYEDRWTALQALKVLGGSARTLCLEPPGREGDGIEFILECEGWREFHQVKRQRARGQWTLNALKDEGLLATFASTLAAPDARCVFVSAHSAAELARLTEDARSAVDVASFERDFTGATHWRQKLATLKEIWGEDDAGVVHDRLRRIHVETISVSVLEDTIAAHAGRLFDLADKHVETFTADLTDILRASLHQRLTAETVRAALSGRGYRPNPWIRRDDIVAELDAVNERGIQSLRHTLIGGALVRRAEGEQLCEAIARGRVTLVKGAPGCGKSALLLQVVETLREQRIPYLLLRLSDVMTADASSSSDLGREAGLTGSPTAMLGRFADDRAVLILDQVDALSVVSGRNSQLLDTVHRLVQEALTDPRLRVVLVCRTFDLEHDFRIKRLVETDRSHAVVALTSFTADQVTKVLGDAGLDPRRLTAAQRDLLSTPLALALLVDGGPDRPLDFRSMYDLYDRFLEEKLRQARETAGRDVHWSAIVDQLVDHMSERQTLNAPAALLDEWSSETRALGACGVLTLTAQRVSFFHEEFFDYVFARRHVGRRRSLRELLASDQFLFRRAQVRQVLLYEQSADPYQFAADVTYLLTDLRVRFHLRRLTLSLFAQLTPDHVLWRALEPLLNDPSSKLHLPAWGLLGGHDWFLWADRKGFFEQNLRLEDWRAQRVCFALISVAKTDGPRVAVLLRTILHRDRKWSSLVRSALHHSKLDHRELFETYRLYLTSSSNQFTPDDSVDDFAREMSGAHPAWACELVGLCVASWVETAARDGVKEIFEAKSGIITSRLHLEFFPLACERAPGAFFQFVWPSMLTAMDVARTDRATALIHDEIWRSRHHHLFHDVHECLLLGAEAAARTLATTDPPAFLRLVEQHAAEGRETAIYILYEGFIAGGPPMADAAARFLLQDRRRLEVSYALDPVWGTCRLLQAISPNVADDVFVELEAAVRNHDNSINITYEGRVRTEFALLGSLARARLGPATRRRLGELQRLFRRDSPEAPTGLQGGMVQSPIEPGKAAKMSDEHWLGALERHHEDRVPFRSFPPVGGAEELAHQLEDATKREPPRFASLALRFPDTTNPAYFDAVLRGLHDPSTLPLSTTEQLLRRCHALPNRPCGRWLSHPLQKYDGSALESLSSDVADALAWYAVNDPDPDTDDREALLLHGLNSVRGATAGAIADLTRKCPALLPRFGSAIDALCNDRTDAVRAMTAEILLVELNHAPDRAFTRFQQLIDGRGEGLLATHYVKWFVRYHVESKFDVVRPVVIRMLESVDPDLRKYGAVFASLAALDRSDASTLSDGCLSSSDSAVRAGVADVYASNLTTARFRTRCEDALRQLFNDPEASVRECAADAIRRLTGPHLDTLESLAQDFLDSPAFRGNEHDLHRALSESSPMPQRLTLRYCDKLLDRLEQGEQTLHYTVRETLALLLRINAVAETSAERNRILDRIDRGLMLGAFDLGDLDKVERE